MRTKFLRHLPWNITLLLAGTSSNAYGFARSTSGNPAWYSQPLSGTPLGAVPK